MKKIFTVLLAAGTISFSFAQTGTSYNGHSDNSRFDNKKVTTGYGQPNTYNDHNASFFSSREKDQQIQQINRVYDKKIDAVKKNRRMNYFEKSKQVKLLEHDRNMEISQVQARYDRSNRKFSDKDLGRNNSKKW